MAAMDDALMLSPSFSKALLLSSDTVIEVLTQYHQRFSHVHLLESEVLIIPILTNLLTFHQIQNPNSAF
jgi:hypothetical protein